MRPLWGKWMIAMGIIAILLLIGGIVFLFDADKRREAFTSWETATPLKCLVDFSKPAQYEAEFYQTCSSSHGEMVALRIPPEVLTTNSITQLLSGLKATIEIRPTSGTNVIDSAGADILWQTETLDGTIPIFSISPFRKGQYKAHIVVSEGAPALAGHTQELEARYLLCGLEALPAEIAKVIGITLLVLGFIFAGIVAVLLVKRGHAISEQ